MTVNITIAPSPKRRKQLRVPESQYLVALATQIAEDHPQATVRAQYGQHADEVMVVRRAGEEDILLF